MSPSSRCFRSDQHCGIVLTGGMHDYFRLRCAFLFCLFGDNQVQNKDTMLGL